MRCFKHVTGCHRPVVGENAKKIGGRAPSSSSMVLAWEGGALPISSR